MEVTTARAGILAVLEEEIGKIAKKRNISAETSIVRDLGLDSLEVMNFIMALEDRFDVSIPLDMVAEVETVGDLAAVIESLKDEEGAR